ncbi:amidase [Alteribacter populi]|uniref:amidase n=1 Tax=Alteribacter populi TaxID=2011011 RepID=UPI000BBAB4A3|nr:amidase [Alteribacter populi]
MNLETFCLLDATDMAELIKKKEIKSNELLDLSFQQLEKMNPSLNAIVHTRFERAFSEAQNMEHTSTSFMGVPMLLKNISQSVKGEPMTAGSALLKENVAKLDSHFVAKLREGGSLFIGHTNTPEFGLKNISEPAYYGPTRNPWNLEYSSGGSSGGSAAAVAAGIVPVAGASDGGGSIRIPASFTGLVGLKPTRGRTPVGPGVGRQWQGAAIDFVLSRSVRDSAAMLDLLQVVQPEAAFQTPLFPGSYINEMKKRWKKPLRIGFSKNSPVGTPVSEEAKLTVEKTMKWLEVQGHFIEEKEPDVNGVELMRNYYLMNCGEMAALIETLEKSLGRIITSEDIEIESWMLKEAGQSVTAAEFTASLAAWDTAAAQMADYHKTYDLFITPTTAYPAPRIGELTHSDKQQDRLQQEISSLGKHEQQQLIYEMFLPSLTYTPFTQLANLTGQPAISLPVHVTSEGLPIGVQVMAPKGREDVLLKLAFLLEQSNLWAQRKWE